MTVLLVWILTRRWELAILSGSFEICFKIILFCLHERIWEHIQFGRRSLVPPVIWFTGLSGSGKTTLGRNLVEKLKKEGLKVEVLDGDELRLLLPSTGYTQAERNQHVCRTGILARYLQRNDIAVIASLISPYEESRYFCKTYCKNFYEIYLSTPIEICEQRDPKGLYRKLRNGEITGFTGIDAPYEVPRSPDLVLDTSVKSIDNCVEEIWTLIKPKSFRRKPWNILKFWSLRLSSS